MLLKGNFSQAEKSLEKKMLAASEQLRFEAAAKYRDSIRNLQRLSTHQKIKSTPGTEKDIFGFFETETYSAIAVLLVRCLLIIQHVF